jgi:hypothetical protein
MRGERAVLIVLNRRVERKNRNSVPGRKFLDHLEATDTTAEIERNKTARFNPTESHARRTGSHA